MATKKAVGPRKKRKATPRKKNPVPFPLLPDPGLLLAGGVAIGIGMLFNRPEVINKGINSLMGLMGIDAQMPDGGWIPGMREQHIGGGPDYPSQNQNQPPPVELPDYYRVLGVHSSATQEQIEGAFKFLAKKWHPDLNQGHEDVATQMMKEINVAYGVVGDPAMRERYMRAMHEQDMRRRGRM